MTTEATEPKPFTAESFLYKYPKTHIRVGGAKRETDAEGWEHDRYRVEVHFHGAPSPYRTIYRKGTGHHGTPPSAAELILSIASDCSTVTDGQTFEEWADSVGYDTDSRKAEAIWKTILQEHKAIVKRLGNLPVAPDMLTDLLSVVDE